MTQGRSAPERHVRTHASQMRTHSPPSERMSRWRTHAPLRPSAFFGIGAIVYTFGCAQIPPPRPLVPPTFVEWRAALADLKAASAQVVGGGPHTLKLALALREPTTGRRLEARGAVALSPAERAARMILVGPGGTTAFDLWLKADQFRVSIPAVDLLRRGDASTPKAEMRGLPVDFLRFWLLDPARGDLLWVEKTPTFSRYTVRDGAAVTTLTLRADKSVEAHRQTWAPSLDAPVARVLIDEEHVIADKLGCGHAVYTQASTGVHIEITCDGVEPNPPSDRAFIDPDAHTPDEEEP
ncbi:MAG: hypothetical protein IPK82_41575 [Polyangiaceae bacterium]|nr:hypothetical protein [Polyangiaceae bacterium]